MTREEFRDYVESLRSQNEISYDIYSGLIDGIDTLEQEPCEDCVSREAVENAIAEMTVNGESLGYAVAYDILSDLPPVTPKQKAGKWIRDKENCLYNKCSNGK